MRFISINTLYIFTFILFIAPYANALYAGETNDSLIRILNKATDKNIKIKVCRNLADINSYAPGEITFLKKIYEIIKNTSDDKEKANTLSEIAITYSSQNKLDSASCYMKLLNEMPVNNEIDKYRSYASMILFYRAVAEDNGEEALTDKLNSFKTEKNNSSSIYRRIEKAYIMSAALECQNKLNEALPYIESASKMAGTLSLKDGYDYKVTTMKLLARIYTRTGRNKEAIQIIEQFIKIKEIYYERYCIEERPYYPMKQFYISSYNALLMNAPVMQKEKVDYYFNKIVQLCKNSSRPQDKYNCFLSMNNYYAYNNNMKMAIETNDSLIKYATIIAPYNLSGLYEISSKYYEKYGNYKKALSELRRSIIIKDSIEVNNVEEKLNLLQVEYGVNKLKYEKSILEIRNKQIINIAMLAILALAFVVCTYLYLNLRKEKRLKEQLRCLMTKADESEKMKSAFINSVCHEIRTPLNAIVGFSGIISEPDFDYDEDSRKEFTKEISKNTNLLISLIESMLEVANLDVSEERLHCEPTDIAVICFNLMDSLKNSGKENISYNVEISETPLIMPTNGHYFSVVIQNLLENANKFTDSGSITLSCDKNDDEVKIAVTDTGCGIPEDMHKSIFDRFVKVDTYKQGNGLGLYLCQLIIKRLSGEIFVDPDYIYGTRIVIILPVIYTQDDNS